MENETYQIQNFYVRGVLEIRGSSLARGYITSELAVTLFIGSYFTVDVVDARSGHIQFIGRVDNQVKWKGVRVDLAELEKEFIMCLGLLQVAIVYSNQMLIAFMAGNKLKMQYTVLLEKLKDRTHIPDHFVQMEKMPLNSSGKIEKSLLLQAFENIRKSYKREIVALENSLEEKVQRFLTISISEFLLFLGIKSIK